MQDKNTLTEAYCENYTAQKGTGSTECRQMSAGQKCAEIKEHTHTHTHTQNKNEYKKG